MASTPPPGDAAFVCISRVTPRWVRRRPLLLVRWLQLTNRFRGSGYVLVIALVLLAVFVWLVTRPLAAQVLAVASDRWPLAFVAGFAHAATSVARRKPRLQVENAGSWLAALPHRVSVPSRIALGFLVQLVVAAMFCIGIAAASSVPWADARTAWLALFSGYVAGGLLGWFGHVFFPAGTKGSEHAVVRRVRDKWAVAPKLYPLSFWPVAWARALNNPQVSARTLLAVLLGLPMGTTGAVAIAIAAGWMVALYVVINLVATIRTAFAAGWWLMPTPVERSPFTRTLVSRALLIQVAVLGGLLLALIAASGKPQRVSLAFGAVVVWLLFYVGTVVIACAAAMRTGRSAP
jgi:hypothetical protein